MAYKIKVSPIAKSNIKVAIDFYNIHANKTVVNNLVLEIERSYKLLSIFPYFRKYYNNYRGFPLNDFPYILFFEIVEKNKLVLIKALFNTYQNPDKYPK